MLRRVRWGWAVLSVLLFGTGALVAAEWLFALCALAGAAAGSLAVAGGRTARGVFFGAVAVPVAAVRALPWLARGLRSSGGPKLARPVVVTLLLLLVFVPLLAGADAAFAGVLGSAVPQGSAVPTAVLFVSVGVGVVACLYLLERRPAEDGVSVLPRTFQRRDWALPVGALVVLFAGFVAVQVTAILGGDAYVLRTAGLTYAEYARRGFWQLLAVTVLTLGVVAVAARFARVESPADRGWLRALLGALCGLTLVIVVSALARMWFYQQAYGFTVLRVLVAACELWLGVVYLLVLVAGVRLRGRWLARAVVGTGFAALLGLALLNPDRFIAERNIARWQDSGRIDTAYLSRLSDDAIPAIATLPDDLRSCALRDRVVTEGGWREWNLARAEARDVLASLPRARCER
ncbi:DUF4173 domain-containing protein [Saccharothrix sp. SC076]|nr:DUF4173 domain-containing protein [Saccharothrix obliqua]